MNRYREKQKVGPEKFDQIQNAIKIEEMPDYYNNLTMQIEETQGPFNYDNPHYNVDVDNSNAATDDSEDELVQDGPYELVNGAIYTGEFNQSGQRQGRGFQIWPDGSKYEGFWSNDKAHGYGRMIFSNGDFYHGEWIESKFCGKGTYQHRDGTKLTCMWQNDSQNGYGIETWLDGANF